MNFQSRCRFVALLSCFLMVVAFVGQTPPARAAGFVGTQTCINCHSTWPDNGPSTADVASGVVSDDYYPLNLYGTRGAYPFYTIPEAYTGSIHNVTAFNLVDPDHVTCEGCHGSGIAHYGIGQIPVPIPQAKNCGQCHQPPYFEIAEFLATGHANATKHPGKYYDQPRNGTKQATQSYGVPEKVSLYQRGTFGPVGDPVSRNMRIQECSVCHSYALNYPTFAQSIVQGNMPNPQVSCGACHDSHIVAPNGREPVPVTSTVKVTGLSGTTVTAVAPVQGRGTYPINNKPFKVNAGGAQDEDGVWTRGSASAWPSLTLASGAGTLSAANGSNHLTVAGGASLESVKPSYTLFISTEASATATLPADAVDAGKSVTVKAALNKAGFEVEEAHGDTIVFTPAPVAVVPVTYKKTAGGTGTLNVSVPLSGAVTFEVRNMYTNTEALCGSCHTRGKYKYSVWGKKSDGTYIDVSSTHNVDVTGQYRRSGHADRKGLAFAEFSAWEFGSTHQVTYPFDMSISGSGGVNSQRNGNNIAYTLTQTPNASNAYLTSTAGVTANPVPINNYACNQCHHGIGSIDYQLDRQGTSEASVLWGDATVTCVTCHDPHKEGAGDNVRVPLKLSYNSRFVSTSNPRGGINRFMDVTEIPSNVGKGIICLFCHQGRESGYTVYDRIKSRVNPCTEPDKVINPAGFNFVNPHYYDSGAILWSRNAWEYYCSSTPTQYNSGIGSHQSANCSGCHMAEATADNSEGGHTWKPKLETCQSCHGPISSFFSVTASGDYDGNGVVQTAFAEIGTVGPGGSTGTGLFGQMITALDAKGIAYNPDAYPYFFKKGTSDAFTAWTTNTLSAAFNLAYAYKAGNAVYVHNTRYAAQILQDSLKALGQNKNWYRPAGDRPATNYPSTVVP